MQRKNKNQCWPRFLEKNPFQSVTKYHLVYKKMRLTKDGVNLIATFEGEWNLKKPDLHGFSRQGMTSYSSPGTGLELNWNYGGM